MSASLEDDIKSDGVESRVRNQLIGTFDAAPWSHPEPGLWRRCEVVCRLWREGDHGIRIVAEYSVNFRNFFKTGTLSRDALL
jgi:hypothetical protein